MNRIPGPMARRLTPGEIAFEVQRNRPCDEEHCIREVRIVITTYKWDRDRIQTFRTLYCEHHGQLIARWHGSRIKDAPDETEAGR